MALGIFDPGVACGVFLVAARELLVSATWDLVP